MDYPARRVASGCGLGGYTDELAGRVAGWKVISITRGAGVRVGTLYIDYSAHRVAGWEVISTTRRAGLRVGRLYGLPARWVAGY